MANSGGAGVTLSVIIPVFNEELTIRAVIERVLSEVPHELEVIVVNDGSTDGTAEIIDGCAAADKRVLVVHQTNGGKASALKRGFEMSRGEVVIIQDGDMEYDPAEIDHVIQPILLGQADVVYGSRFLVRRAARVLYFYHYVANRCLTFLSNILTNLNMTDIETGYKALRGDIIRNMVIESSGFGVEVEITAKVAKLDAVVYEVPISYYGRTYQEGKKIGFTDGLLALWYILLFNVFRGRERSFRTIPEAHAIRTHSFSKRPANFL